MFSEEFTLPCESAPEKALKVVFESSTVSQMDMHSMVKARKVQDFFRNEWDDRVLNLSKVRVYQITWFGRPQEGVYDPATLGFVYMEIFCTLRGVLGADGKERALPGIVFFRGDSVSVDIDLQVVDEHGGVVGEYSLFVCQARVPGGKRVYERVAGMVNGDGDVAGAMVAEVSQETGLKKPNVSELERLGEMYPSVGGTKEKITLFYWRTTISLEKFQELSDKGKVYGCPEELEFITVRLVPKEHVNAFIAECGDAKAGHAMFLRMLRDPSLAASH